MAYEKLIVCLAASRKHAGTCIAGRELAGTRIGPWLRPVSREPGGELSSADIILTDGQMPRLLDLLRISLLRPVPQGCQTENHRSNPAFCWEKQGVYARKDLGLLADEPPSLWVNGCHSTGGQNDRVPADVADETLSSSLYLIRPDGLRVTVNNAPDKRRVRASFEYRGVTYSLKITDRKVERYYSEKADGSFPVDVENIFLCVSLGEPFEGFRYKLVASVMRGA
jgi:hypothetical protein